MKKVSRLLLIVLVLFLITGCNSEKLEDKDYDIADLNHISCTRDAYVDDEDTSVDININVYYDDAGYIKMFNSKEEIKSSNIEVLDKYEKAYKDVYKEYEKIKYYDNVVTRDSNKVTSTTIINYGKVDMDKVLEIEGEEDNVKVVNGKIKISDWKEFAEKYGTRCK